MTLNRLNTNATKLIAIQFLVGFVLWYGIENTFIRNELGFGPIGISLIVTTYLLVTFALEVPSGILADRWGRKNLLIASIILFLLANLILGSATTMAIYLVGTVVWGLHAVTLSGTLESITYDSLLAEGKAKLFQKVDAYQNVAFMIGIFFSSALAGIAAPEYGLRSTFYLSSIPLLLAIGVALLLKEPNYHKQIGDQKILVHAKKALTLITGRALLLKIALMFGVILLAENFLYEYSQYYYLELFNNNVSVAAVLNGTTGLFLALGYALASRVRRFEYMLLACGILMAVAGYWHSPWAIVTFCCLYPFVAIAENRTQTALQHKLESDVRATSTSVVNFLGSCIIIPLSFGFAALIESFGAQKAYFVAGIGFVIAGSLFVFTKLSIKNGAEEHIMRPEATPRL